MRIGVGMNKTNMNSISDILDQTADDLLAPAQEIEPKQTKPEELDIAQLKSLVYKMKDTLDNMLRVLENKQIEKDKIAMPDSEPLKTGERIVEGVFNGEKMVGADGKEYSIPPNYASKSKLVEGDMLKLTITNNGSFIFKQIGPIERKSLIGEVVGNGEQYSVLADGRTYKILTASVTFYKGKPGDEAVILVPKNSGSDWAAVDNIIAKT